MIAQITQARKALAAVIGQALTFASVYYGTNHYVDLAIALAGALGVWAVPNTAPAAKPAPAEKTMP